MCGLLFYSHVGSTWVHPPVFSGVCVTGFLVLYVCFVDRCLSFCTFSFCYCVVCSSSIYGFRFPLWYLQTLLMHNVQDYDSILSTITLLTMLNVWVGMLLTCGQHLSSSPVFNGVRVTRSLVLYECFVARCLSFCIFFFWPLCCLFFFDIRIMIVPLVSSNSS